MAVKVNFQGWELAAPTPRDDYHDVTIVSCGGTTTVRPGDVMPTLTGERIRCIEASAEFYNSPAFNRLRPQLARDAKLITRPRPGAQEEPAVSVAPKKTTIEVPIPSPEERVAKIEKIAESAQRAADAIKGAVATDGGRPFRFLPGGAELPDGWAVQAVNVRKSLNGYEHVCEVWKAAPDIDAQYAADAVKNTAPPVPVPKTVQGVIPPTAQPGQHIHVQGEPLRVSVGGRDAAEGVFRSTTTIPASKVVGERVTVRVDGVPVGYATGISFTSKPYPPAAPETMELRHARMNVEDLRKKLDDARRELRYQRAIAPEGTRRVDGFVSAVKGRETSRHVAMHVYLDGKRARRVMEAHSGAEGFIITCDDGNPDARRMKTGIVHVFEFTGSPSALPDSLEFAP